MPNFLIFSALVPLLQRKTVVLDLHDTMPETFASSFTGWRKRLFVPALLLEEQICCALADHIVCVNELQRATVIRRQPRVAAKTIISMNVPDPKRFTRTGPAGGDRNQGNKFKLVYHGGLLGRLTVDRAIHAVARVRERIPEIQLHIIGDGDAKDRLVELAKELGLEDSVVFHGRMSFDALIPLIRTMDVGIVPLERNPATELMLSVKLMECLSLGIPAIAPKLQAIRHYFSEDMLFFFEPGDVDSLARAIESARDPAQRLTRLAHAQAFLNRYHWSNHKTSLLAIYGFNPSVEATLPTGPGGPAASSA